MITSFNIVVAMKPLDGNFAQNAVKHGVAGLNVDEGRIGVSDGDWKGKDGGGVHPHWIGKDAENDIYGKGYKRGEVAHNVGRFPANVLHDGSEAVLAGFPNCKGMSGGGVRKCKSTIMPSIQIKGHSDNEHLYRGDSGKAARFFKEIKEFEE